METPQTLIFNASREGKKEIVSSLMNNVLVDINMMNQNQNMNCLMVACLEGHLDVVEILMKQNDVNLNLTDNSYGETAFFIACSYGREKIVTEMVRDPRVDITLSNELNWSPLMAAAYYGNIQCVKIILDSKPPRAIVDQKSNQDGGFPVISSGSTARDIALQRKKLDIVNLLDSYLNSSNLEGVSLGENLLFHSADGKKRKVEELLGCEKKKQRYQCPSENWYHKDIFLCIFNIKNDTLPTNGLF